MKVAIIGTVGVPANYGGFETLVEQLISNRHNKDIEYTVFCSKKKYDEILDTYKGVKLEYVNFDANGVQSIPYDIVSLIRATRKSDAILVLGVSGCSILPIYRLFSRKRLIINIDGLEHRREKWNKYAKKFLKFSEAQAVKYADVIVTDNQGITDYVANEYGKPSELIAYGGDHVLQKPDADFENSVLGDYGIEKGNYDLSLCRIEPENNVHVILKAYEGSNRKIVFIGNWDKSEYGRELKEKYKNSGNIHLKNAEYDIRKLYALRNNCRLYIHGHSAGGTNPSLVEAMHFGMPICAFDCVYNRETTENKAIYFKNSEDLRNIAGSENLPGGNDMKEIAERRYTWDIIARSYEALLK